MIISSAGKTREAMLSPNSWARSGIMTRRFVVSLVFTGFAALSLAGCTSLLGGDSSSKLGGPSSVTVPVGNNLAMPPDLQLATPGTAHGYQAEALQEDAPVVPQKKKTAALAKPKAGSDSIYDGGVASAAPQDVFDQYSISKTKPDGTPKTQAELSEELKLVILRKKKQQNPSYGTIGNIGNIFNDQ
jgi:hypothetical protein